jgi:putative N6-adenine-specific DNA methylase
MCGSGTFAIEAAEMACGLNPGRSRTFAFEKLATFDQARWDRMRAGSEPLRPAVLFHGSDRDAGAIEASRANARRAGVDHVTRFARHAISDITPPDGPPGLVIVNPPYGARIGDRAPLFGLYGALGKTLLARFGGWRAGLITTDSVLARATGLPFDEPSPPILHGGLRVTLFQTGPLP